MIDFGELSYVNILDVAELMLSAMNDASVNNGDNFFSN
jgi:hypothetical protein